MHNRVYPKPIKEHLTTEGTAHKRQQLNREALFYLSAFTGVGVILSIKLHRAIQELRSL